MVYYKARKNITRHPSLKSHPSPEYSRRIMKAAYVIGNITIVDNAIWLEYKSKVPATLIPWGGEILLRGNTLKVLAGEYQHTDNVVIRFPNVKALNSWFSSPAYQAIVPLRDQGAKVDLISYQEG